MFFFFLIYFLVGFIRLHFCIAQNDFNFYLNLFRSFRLRVLLSTFARWSGVHKDEEEKG